MSERAERIRTAAARRNSRAADNAQDALDRLTAGEPGAALGYLRVALSHAEAAHELQTYADAEEAEKK